MQKSCAEKHSEKVLSKIELVRVEEAVEHASIDEIKGYYARVHGMFPEDVAADPRFPFHPNYKYGDASKCCADCEELEMAITVNITSTSLPLAKWFPELAKARHPEENTEPS